MKQMEEEVSQKQQDMMDQIASLHADIEKWESISQSWRRECEKAQSMLERERQSRQHLELEMKMMREGSDVSTEAVALKPRTRRHPSETDDHPDDGRDKMIQSGGSEDLTCGNCSNDSRCQCIEEAFELNEIATGTADHGGIKRTLSPQNMKDFPKRTRPNIEDIEDSTEIDFTTRKLPSLPKTSSSSSDPVATAPIDSCGFCQNGGACACAAITLYNESERTQKQASTSCTNDPGNCAQCRTIPASKNFCTTLAASRTTTANDTDDSHSRVSRSKEPTLNCADAFNRLAEHPYYPRASTQLQTWIPQLATRAVPSASTSQENKVEERPAFEIEAASVMNVLKMFEVRFADEPKKEE